MAQLKDPTYITGTSNKVYHSGNDGHGSGFDATYLDGKLLSSFLTKQYNIGVFMYKLYQGVSGSGLDTYVTALLGSFYGTKNGTLHVNFSIATYDLNHNILRGTGEIDLILEFIDNSTGTVVGTYSTNVDTGYGDWYPTAPNGTYLVLVKLKRTVNGGTPTIGAGSGVYLRIETY